MHGVTATDPTSTASGSHPVSEGRGHAECVCQVYQEAIELVGRRWTGAIITVLLGRPRRFCEISAAVPDLSDRLLAQRLKELEERGIVERTPCEERASSVRYSLSPMGEDLAPALDALGLWANRWLSDRPS